MEVKKVATAIGPKAAGAKAAAAAAQSSKCFRGHCASSSSFASCAS
jgi:hypothetical protein